MLQSFVELLCWEGSMPSNEENIKEIKSIIILIMMSNGKNRRNGVLNVSRKLRVYWKPEFSIISSEETNSLHLIRFGLLDTWLIWLYIHWTLSETWTYTTLMEVDTSKGICLNQVRVMFYFNVQKNLLLNFVFLLTILI